MLDSNFKDIKPEDMLSDEQRREREKIPVSCFSEMKASERHPGWCEDFIIENSENNIYGVFDGVGGEAAGNIASRISGKEINKFLSENINSQNSQEEVKQKILEAYKLANKSILESIKTGKGRKGMATTATVGIIHNKHMIIGHAGDSRAYLFRKNELSPLTKDQTMVRRLVDLGQLKEEEIDSNPYKHMIYGSIDGNNIEPEIIDIEILPGDKIIFTSDGVHDNLRDSEIQETVINTNTMDLSKKLVSESVRNSHAGLERSKLDDMSSLVVAIGPEHDISNYDALSAKYEALTGKKPPKYETGSGKKLSKSEQEKLLKARLNEVQKKELIKKGDLVFVKRSNGQLEKGWIVSNYDKKTGHAIVQKKSPEGYILEKRIPKNELYDLNKK